MHITDLIIAMIVGACFGLVWFCVVFVFCFVFHRKCHTHTQKYREHFDLFNVDLLVGIFQFHQKLIQHKLLLILTLRADFLSCG